VEKVVLFANEKSGVAGRRLQRAIESAVSDQHLENLKSIKELSKRLSRFPSEIAVAVLLAESKDQLSKLLSLRDFLDDVRIILVLPDRENETMSKGHLLRPRFLTYVDGNFTDIAQVLSKMLEALHSKYQSVEPGG
jgi:excinuclease UvrABC ATPase subunit